MSNKNDITNNKILFSDVEIAGGVNYYLYERDYVGDVEFVECSEKATETVKRPLFEESSNIVIALNKSVSIMNKVISYEDFSGLSAWATGRNAFGIS
jgi:site-specific DNA-methyltransferase (adenine-specific)